MPTYETEPKDIKTQAQKHKIFYYDTEPSQAISMKVKLTAKCIRKFWW